MTIVQHTLTHPRTGKPRVNALVRVKLATNGYTSSGHVEILGESDVVTDATGLYSIDLVRQSLIDPSGTHYEVTHPGGEVLSFVVTDATGPLWLRDLLVVNPPAPPPITAGVMEVVAGTNVTVDDTDPRRPIVSASGSGGGAVASVNGHTGAVALAASDVGADATGAAAAAQTAAATDATNKVATETTARIAGDAASVSTAAADATSKVAAEATARNTAIATQHTTDVGLFDASGAAAAAQSAAAADATSKVAAEATARAAGDALLVPLSSMKETITYNGDGTVNTVTETVSGAVTTYTYNSDGTIATESRVLGGTTLRTFTYSGGNLVGVS